MELFTWISNDDGVNENEHTYTPHTHLDAHRTSGRMSENIYSFTAEANDNKARFRCEASNIMSQTPLKAEVDLTVMCKYLIIVGLIE